MIDEFNGRHVILPSLEEEEQERIANQPLLSIPEQEIQQSQQQLHHPHNPNHHSSKRKRKNHEIIENIAPEMTEEEKRKNSIALYLIIPGVLVPGLLCYVWLCYLKDVKSISLRGTRVIIQVFSVFTSIIQVIFIFVFIAVIYLGQSSSSTLFKK